MKSILLCIDGSEYADSCMRYATWIASISHAKLHVLYVSEIQRFELPLIADIGGSIGAQPYQGLMAQLCEIEAEKAKLLESMVSKHLSKHDSKLDIDFHYRKGSLVDVVTAFEEEHRCDLVVIGKRGENANRAVSHLGSGMERVVRASEQPCFVCSREYHEVKNVMLAYDGSDSMQKALKWAAQSDLLKGKAIHLIAVDEGHHASEVLSHLSKAEETLKAHFPDASVQMLSGGVEDSICEYVKKASIDLLLMGAYGHSRIRELIIGSTTSHLIRGCHIPVLMFR